MGSLPTRLACRFRICSGSKSTARRKFNACAGASVRPGNCALARSITHNNPSTFPWAGMILSLPIRRWLKRSVCSSCPGGNDRNIICPFTELMALNNGYSEGSDSNLLQAALLQGLDARQNSVGPIHAPRNPGVQPHRYGDDALRHSTASPTAFQSSMLYTQDIIYGRSLTWRRAAFPSICMLPTN